MTVTTWTIYCGKREYKLSEPDFERLKREIANNKTMVWFKDFVISIPHISSMERVYEHKDELPQLPAQSPMEREKVREKLAELKKQFKVKVMN